MRNKTFFDSVKCATVGLISAIKTEKNYKYYFGIAIFFMILNFVLGVDMVCHLIWIINVLGVFSAECLNTSVEHFVNMVDKEIKPEIKLIKDISAGGVLCWGIAFFTCEFVMLGWSLV